MGDREWKKSMLYTGEMISTRDVVRLFGEPPVSQQNDSAVAYFPGGYGTREEMPALLAAGRQVGGGRSRRSMRRASSVKRRLLRKARASRRR
jgi:hypothetical protein